MRVKSNPEKNKKKSSLSNELRNNDEDSDANNEVRMRKLLCNHINAKRKLKRSMTPPMEYTKRPTRSGRGRPTGNISFSHKTSCRTLLKQQISFRRAGRFDAWIVK